MTFTTVGFGEITAASRVAEFYSTLEVFIGFVFVAYILSGFSSIKDGLSQNNIFNTDENKGVQENLENTKNNKHQHKL